MCTECVLLCPQNIMAKNVEKDKLQKAITEGKNMLRKTYTSTKDSKTECQKLDDLIKYTHRATNDTQE